MRSILETEEKLQGVTWGRAGRSPCRGSLEKKRDARVGPEAGDGPHSGYPLKVDLAGSAKWDVDQGASKVCFVPKGEGGALSWDGHMRGGAAGTNRPVLDTVSIRLILWGFKEGCQGGSQVSGARREVRLEIRVWVTRVWVDGKHRGQFRGVGCGYGHGRPHSSSPGLHQRPSTAVTNDLWHKTPQIYSLTVLQFRSPTWLSAGLVPFWRLWGESQLFPSSRGHLHFLVHGPLPPPSRGAASGYRMPTACGSATSTPRFAHVQLWVSLIWNKIGEERHLSVSLLLGPALTMCEPRAREKARRRHGTSLFLGANALKRPECPPEQMTSQ